MVHRSRSLRAICRYDNAKIVANEFEGEVMTRCLWYSFIVTSMLCLFGAVAAQELPRGSPPPSNGKLVLNLNNVHGGPMFLNLLKQGVAALQFRLNLMKMATQSERSPGAAPGCGFPADPTNGTPNYVIKFVGKGAIEIADKFTVVPGGDPGNCVQKFALLIVLSTSSSGCRVTFHFISNPGASILGYFPITASGKPVIYSGMAKAVLVLQSEEAALDNCADIVCFDPNYLGTISSRAGIPLGGASINPQIVRTLDLTETSNENLSDWSGIPTPSAFSYSSNLTPARLWGGLICATSGACSPTPTSNIYRGANSPNAEGYTGCVDGEQYEGMIADASVASPAPTLNVGNGRCVARIGIIGN